MEILSRSFYMKNRETGKYLNQGCSWELVSGKERAWVLVSEEDVNNVIDKLAKISSFNGLSFDVIEDVTRITRKVTIKSEIPLIY